jgi:hypothetical protein
VARHGLIEVALAVLDANWTGTSTRPSPELYPHQWSWDSAFIAIGRAPYDAARARQELRSLFRGQWSDGLLPHIVFEDDPGRYFPGPEVWDSGRSPHAPRDPRTSGIVQPPIHATAVWHVHRHGAEPAAGKAFLEEMLPKLAAWHAYLYRERGDANGLVEIWHPWESGMDNSPLWDDALSRLGSAVTDVPAYERVDLTVAAEVHRPTQAEYDAYVYLVARMRERSYRAGHVRSDTPFAVHDVLFNAILVRANQDLAAIARELGADAHPFEEWAAQTAAAIEAMLWSEEVGMYLDIDARSGEPIRVRVGSGFAPLLAEVPDERRAARLVATLDDVAVTTDHGAWLVPSLARDDPRFEPERYWRGPAWPVVQWVVQQGLDRYGYGARAARLRHGLLDTAARAGIWEHYDPVTGRPGGADRFAWTAAIVLELLRTESAGGPAT